MGITNISEKLSCPVLSSLSYRACWTGSKTLLVTFLFFRTYKNIPVNSTSLSDLYHVVLVGSLYFPALSSNEYLMCMPIIVLICKVAVFGIYRIEDTNLRGKKIDNPYDIMDNECFRTKTKIMLANALRKDVFVFGEESIITKNEVIEIKQFDYKIIEYEKVTASDGVYSSLFYTDVLYPIIAKKYYYPSTTFLPSRCDQQLRTHCRNVGAKDEEYESLKNILTKLMKGRFVKKPETLG